MSPSSAPTDPGVPSGPHDPRDVWDVDVVVPTHDRAHTLGTALESIRDQSVRPARVIVVDDASADGTDAVLASSAVPGLQVIRLPVRSGASVARNRGIEAATAGWVAFLDSDDRWAPHHLETLRGLVRRRNVVAGFATSRVLRHGRPPIEVGMGDRPSEELRRALLAFNRFTMISAIVDRTAARAVGGFSTTMRTLEDWDFFLRLSESGPIVATSDVTSTAHPSASGVNAASASLRLEAVDEVLARFEATYARYPESESRLRCWSAQLALDAGDRERARRDADRAWRLRRSPWSLAHAAFVRAPALYRVVKRMR